MCRNYASAGGCTTNPIIFEPMVMSILIAQQSRIRQLEKDLAALKPLEPSLSANIKSNEMVQSKVKAIVQTAERGGIQIRLS